MDVVVGDGGRCVGIGDEPQPTASRSAEAPTCRIARKGSGACSRRHADPSLRDAAVTRCDADVADGRFRSVDCGDQSALVQTLVDAHDGLADGAHVQLWVSVDVVDEFDAFGDG
jgi:hypothetical protein